MLQATFTQRDSIELLKLEDVINMAEHASRDEMLDAFGPFAVIFEPIGDDSTPYLSLLHLHHDRVANVIALISDAANSDDSESSIVSLLQDVDWRPHLVGAVANYFRKFDSATAQIWRAVDSGSWVTPQLLAILSLIDEDFLAHSIGRLTSGCPLSNDPDYSVEEPLERHVAQGPSGSVHRSSKAAASLLTLLQIDSADDERVQEIERNGDLQDLIATDVDQSGDVATSWREKLLKLVAEL